MATTLKRELRTLFVHTLAGAGVAIFALVWLTWHYLTTAEAQSYLLEHQEYHRDRLERQLRDFQADAEHLAAELQHLRIASYPDPQVTAQLTAFFTRLSDHEPFSDVALFHTEGRLLYAHGCAASFERYPNPPSLPIDKTLLFFEENPCLGFPEVWVAIPFWLGTRGKGVLLFGRALDHGFLYALADQSRQEKLFLLFEEKVVASSVGEVGLLQPIAAEEMFESHGTVLLQGVVPLSPQLRVLFQIPYQPIIRAQSAALFALLLVTIVTALLWLGVGRWVSNKGSLLSLLTQASAAFRVRLKRSDLLVDLEKLSRLPDEVGQLARDLDQLMREVESRHEALQVTATTLELLDEAVLMLDSQGRICSASAAWRDLVAQHPAAQEANPPFEVFLPDEEHPRWTSLLAALRAAGPGATEGLRLPLFFADEHSPRWLELRAAYLGKEHETCFCLVVRDVSDAVRQEEQLRFLALHDPLTHLPNRRLFSERFAFAKAFADRDASLLAVCLLDLDEFKPVNDRLGHAVGDYLLIEVSRRLQQELRETDTIARLGGDEFALLLTGLKTVDESEAIVQRLISAIGAPYLFGGEQVTVTASVGITFYPIDEAEEIDTLLRHADLAMYRAKQKGRNRFALFDIEEFRQEAQVSHTVVAIKTALERGEMTLYYQPKIDLFNGQVVGVEALIRWRHPERGLVSPAAFIPVVEKEPALAIAVGEWVINAALEQLAQWQQREIAWPVSVNLFAHHFLQPDFPRRLAELLARHPEVSPALLEIEIVESTLVTDMATACRNLQACRELGVLASLDDFGTGYSSLSYLKELPVSVVKLDRSFVHGLLDQPKSLQLMQSVIELVHRLEMTLVAEGVEGREEAFILQRLGCELAQGFAFTRPLPPDELQEWHQNYQPDPELLEWAGVPWSYDDLPVLLANRDSGEWAKRLMRYLDGAHLSLQEVEIGDAHECRFGHWYYHQGQMWRHLPAFAQIEPVHDRLHEVGKSIVSFCRLGDRAAARALLPELLAAKEELDALVERLRVELFEALRQRQAPLAAP